MTDQPTPKTTKAAERAAQRASREAQRERMRAARAAEKQEAKLDKQGEKSRRTADRAAGRTVKPSTAQKLALTGGRLVVGITGIAATVVVLGGVALVNWPSWGVSAPTVQVDPAATVQQRVCPGPFLTVGANSARANTISSLGSVTVTATGGETSAMHTTDPMAAQNGAPEVVAAPSDAAPLAAAQAQNLALESYAGLAVSACTAPTTDTWLVGGGAALGETAVLVISNPTDVIADVRLELFGADGPISAAGLGGISVEPGKQVQFPLSGFAPGETHPVVHVLSAGGRVSAALDVSQINGLVPVGVDVVGPSAIAAKTAVIPGVVVDASSVAAEFGDGADGLPTVRLLSPTGSGSVTISVLGENGVAGTSVSAAVRQGEVLDVPIPGLVAGSYSFSIASDVPVVAAAQSALTSGLGTDFAWFASATELTGSAGIAVPTIAPATLHLVNPTKSAVTVAVKNGQSVTVPASSAVAVSVAAGASQLDGAEGLFAALSLSTPGRLAGFTIAGTAVAIDSVAVTTR